MTCKVARVFTFHYVSIKSKQTIFLCLRLTHLHSTMYLLNPIWHGYAEHRKEFTFHYVSIKSLGSQRSLTSRYHLHSTMYLLNPVPQHLIISQAYFVLFCRPTIIHGNKICIHQKLSLFTA